ncbi:hypothetical protein HOY80DRAFT_710586 [Tuber brumale]|nr:hypothetical protein HOY80DRAFT_710586 [Tuber brumale]
MSLGSGTSSSLPSALPAAALSGLGLSVNNTAPWPAIRPLWLLPFTLARRRAIDPESPREIISRSWWYIKNPGFSVLFSTIIPISLTVNLDMGKSACAWFIEHDKGIKDTVLLLGLATFPRRFVRVEYLLSCKTGVLM